MDSSGAPLDQDKYTRTRHRASRRMLMLAGAPLCAVVIFLLSYPLVKALMGGTGLMWTVWTSAPVQLVVCWENPSDADPYVGEPDQTSGAQRREYVRLALKHAWEREARISFVGWQTCQNEGSPATPPYSLGPRRPGTADENVKIHITYSGQSQNPAHGSYGDYQQSGVLLNLHCGDQACIEHLAIHEFGHVLGLYHEEERSDWPTNIAGCPPQQWQTPMPPWWPIPGEVQWGASDRNSVMAYCSGWPTDLSTGDVAAIQRAYGRHLDGTLLSLPGSLCLSGHANAANGDNAFGWACDEANDDQEWHYDAATRALYITWPSDPSHTRRCLDVDSTNYVDVQIWNCLYGSNQQWSFQQTTLRGYGGLCVTRSLAGVGALTMENCTGSSRQLWRVESSSLPGFVRLYSDTGNLCLTLSGGSGSDALAGPCSFTYLPLVTKPQVTQNPILTFPSDLIAPAAIANPIRDFYMGADGLLAVPSLVSDSLCLDVQDVWDSDYISGQGGPHAGQRVQFFTCTGTQLNQKWGFSGHLVSGSKCLALAGTARENGALARVSACSTAEQQDWDYIW